MTDKLHPNIHHNLFQYRFNKLIKFFLVGLFLCVSNHNISQNIDKIVVNPNQLRTGDCKLSDFAESINYIRLETNNKCLIGHINSFDISENHIVVYCVKSESIYLFNKNGSFINQVGKHGEGPNDYLFVSGLFIDEKRNRIVVIDGYQRKQLNYSLTGQFLDRMPIVTSGGLFRRLHNDHYFIITANYNGNVPFAYEIRDINFKLISENVKTVYYERGPEINMLGFPIHYLYNDKIYAKELSLNDTIYSIEKDYSFRPKYVVNAGRYEVSTDLRAADGYTFIQRIPEFAIFAGFFENKDKLFVLYLFNNRKYFCYYDKNNQEFLYFKSEKGIPNDYDGGLDFWPQRQDNRNLYAFYDAYLFKEELSAKKRETLKGDTKSIQLFNQLAQKIDSEDNPILVIVKIKE